MADPSSIQGPEDAMKLLDKQNLTAKSLSKKDIRNLEKLKQEATDFSELEASAPAKGAVHVRLAEDDASFISEQVELMDRQGYLEKAPTQEDLELEQKIIRDEKERQDRMKPKGPTLGEVLQKTREEEWRKRQSTNNTKQ